VLEYFNKCWHRMGYEDEEQMEWGYYLENSAFRDSEGCYMIYNVDAGSWMRHTGGRWTQGKEPTDMLEGWALLPVVRPPGGEVGLSESHKCDLGLDLLKIVTDNIRQGYMEGRIHSEAAKELLTEFYFYDIHGGVWTVGFQSGKWYVMRENRWQLSATPPRIESLIKKVDQPCRECGETIRGWGKCPHCGADNPPQWAENMEEIGEGFYNFVTKGWDALPEPVTAEWDPPKLPKDFLVKKPVSVICPNCGSENEAGKKFCTQCGNKLEGLLEESDVQEIRTCGNCGSPLKPGAKFCSSCGRQV